MKEKRAVSSALGHHVKDRCGAEQVGGISFVVGTEGDQAGLGIGGALIEREGNRGALGDRVGVTEDPLGGIEDDILGGLRFAGMFEGEGRLRDPGGRRPQRSRRSS